MIRLDTMDFYRTSTDTNGNAVRKPVYAPYVKEIGITRNETVNEVVAADPATAVTINGKVGKTSRPFVNASVRFCIAPDTNWTNAVKTIQTNASGEYSYTGIPRIYVSGNTQKHYYLNCRIDSAGYTRVRIDSIFCNTATVRIDSVTLNMP